MGDIKTMRRSDSGVYTLFSSASSHWHRNTTQATCLVISICKYTADVNSTLDNLAQRERN